MIRSEVKEMADRKICSNCLSRIITDDAPVLTMGAYGTPKLLCPECAALLETVTEGREYDEITSAMQALTERMSKANVDDRFTVATVTEILSESAERAQKIKEGTYDFALDEVESDEGFDEIPEELQETEEDRLLDEKDAEANAKFDEFMNKSWIVVGIVAAGYIAWRLIERFLL